MKNKLKTITLVLAILCSFGTVFSTKEQPKTFTEKAAHLVGWDRKTWGSMMQHQLYYGLPGAFFGAIGGACVGYYGIHQLLLKNWLKKKFGAENATEAEIEKVADKMVNPEGVSIRIYHPDSYAEQLLNKQEQRLYKYFQTEPESAFGSGFIGLFVGACTGYFSGLALGNKIHDK